LDLRRRKFWEALKDCMMRKFITFSESIITVIKSRRTRWAMHVAPMKEMRNA